MLKERQDIESYARSRWIFVAFVSFSGAGAAMVRCSRSSNSLYDEDFFDVLQIAHNATL